MPNSTGRRNPSCHRARGGAGPTRTRARRSATAICARATELKPPRSPSPAERAGIVSAHSQLGVEEPP